MIEDIVCSRWTLIDALERHGIPIRTRIPRQRKIYFLPDGKETDLFFDEVVIDVTPYIIEILKGEGKEIRALREELLECKHEFYKYQQENREFEQFKKWKGRS